MQRRSWWVALALWGHLLACSDAPEEPAAASPVAPARPEPATSGAFLGEDDVLAVPAATEAAPEALVPQLRSDDVMDLAFVGEAHLAILDGRGDVTLLDTADGTVRGRFFGAGREPMAAVGPYVLATHLRVDLRSGETLLPGLSDPSLHTGFSAASPRGDRFVTLESGGSRDAVFLGALPGGAVVARVVHEVGPEPALMWSPSGERFVVCGREGLELRAGSDGALAGRWAPPEGSFVEHCAVRPTGGSIAVLGTDHGVALLHPRTLEVRATVRPEDAQPDRLVWSSDGNLLAAWRRGGTNVTVWDAVSGTVRRSVIAPSPLSSAAIGAGGRWLVTGGEDGAVTAFAMSDGTMRQMVPPSEVPARVVIDPSGEHAAVARLNLVDRIDLRTGEVIPLASIERPVAASVTLAAGVRSPDVLFRVSSPTSGALVRWRPGEGLRTVVPAIGSWLEAEIGDARYIDDHAAYDAESGAVVFEVTDRTLLHVSDDGATFIARRASDGQMLVLDGTGAERAVITLDRDEEPPCRMRLHCAMPTALTRDGARFVMLRNSLLRVFDTATGRVLARRDVGARASRELVLSRDGRVLSLAIEDGRLELVDLQTLRPRYVVRAGEDEEAPLSDFSPEGTIHVHGRATTIGSVRLRGAPRPVEVTVEGETINLEAISETLVIRETEGSVELYESERMTRVLTMEASRERIVWRANNSPEGASLEIVECTGGRLIHRSAAGARDELGGCFGLQELFASADRVVISDRAGVRVLPVPADDVVELVAAVRGETIATGLIDGAGHLLGSPELGALFRVRQAGPLLEATIAPATDRMSPGGR